MLNRKKRKRKVPWPEIDLPRYGKAFALGTTGLCINRSVNEGETHLWCVTHIKSGRYLSKRDSEEKAKQLALELAKVTDWNRTQEDLRGDDDVARCVKSLV